MAAQSTQGDKELLGLSYLCVEHDALKEIRAQDKLRGEACGSEYLYTAGKGDNHQVHCRQI